MQIAVLILGNSKPSFLNVSDVLRTQSLDTPNLLSKMEESLKVGFFTSNSSQYLRYFEVKEFAQWLARFKFQYMSSPSIGGMILTSKEFLPLEDNFEYSDYPEYSDEDLRELRKGGPWCNYHWLSRFQEGSPNLSIKCISVFSQQEKQDKANCVRKQKALEDYLRHQHEPETYQRFCRRTTNNYERWLNDEQLESLVDFMDS